MTVYYEEDKDYFPLLEAKNIAKAVVQESLRQVKCPYEATVNVLVTDDIGIQKINQAFRGIDRPTDVLSFPLIAYEYPGEFGKVKTRQEYFDPYSGELLLGDIVLSATRVYVQAEEYGHGILREYAFLLAHSMLHLCGYDHMTQQEREEMEQRQEAILTALSIPR